MNKYLDFESDIEILDSKINELLINDSNFISEKNKLTEKKNTILKKKYSNLFLNELLNKKVNIVGVCTKKKSKFNSDFSISTTGYAGPSVGKNKLSLGTVFISITTPISTNVSKYQFSGDRELVISQVLDKSLDLIYKEIKKLQ